MKLYTATQAKEDARANKDYKPQRAWVMGAIEREAKQGYTQLVVDGGYSLNPDDWDWLESLGYTVKRPERKLFVPKNQPTMERVWVTFGTVSW